MNKKIKSIRGFNDFLPIDIYLWQKTENLIIKIINSYGYNEIRLPIIEKTNLFKRAIGNETDVIKKEMFTFNDRNMNSITLRPEATVSCVRSGIEHGFLYKKEQRLWYIGPMFRYERPQNGRYRQFNQLGIEVFGLIGPQIDAELILIISRIWKKLGLLKYFSLEINTIGSIKSRIKYNNVLINFFKKNIKLLNSENIEKIYKNPIHILDSKNIKIQKLIKKIPCIYKYLSKKSKIHFYKLCKILKNIGIKYNINKSIIRGLDYYNYTVFEWVTKNINFKSTICGGGRYDKLVENLGGYKTPAIGCAIGLERLILLIKKTKNILKYNSKININIISFNTFNIKFNVIKLVEYIHNKLPNLRLFTNYNNFNIKKQLINSCKMFSNFVIIIGENELYNQILIIKNINNKIQLILPKNEIIIYLKILFFKKLF
ncbi:MAG: histidine--tRNA ligase [Enterobacteriaceae bacterium PSpicST2]|nr:MAG: histidine--tRNA ligase [Enterobacteriaceae bacterium PSpicST2]WMC19136.1 MAG: histidine--tRNA ligase [Enterobacteriaceae bacterium PSpicST1]